MYGFWGEGHTWPFTDHPFPDGTTAERTFVQHARSPTRALEKDPARDEHAARLEPRRQLGAARPHHPQPQLGEDRHHLRRERTDRGDLQPATLGGGSARGGDVGRLAGVAASRRGRHLHRQRHRSRHGRRRQLLVALELARGEGRERHELLPPLPRDDRHHRSPGGLPRAALVRLATTRAAIATGS